MRRHVAAHLWIWVALAAVVVVVNELVDRNFFDHREHIDGDVLVTLVVLLIAILVSYSVVRLRAQRSQPGVPN
ncbi:MAG TPA: hypothetical protein VNR59_10530 [Gaiellaceae bacterium]|nr:hypothetical protein [Gaiellaceae bacterium]